MGKLNLEPYIDRTVWIKLKEGIIYYGVLRTDDGIDFMVYNHSETYLSVPFKREDIIFIGYDARDIGR